MSPLSSTLLYLDFSGHGLAQFPPELMQLTALKCLRALENEFDELPAAVTTLSRLTELTLGRCISHDDPYQLHEKRPLDVRALGDLSGFPALCKLTFQFCEVRMCESLPCAERPASLSSLSFHFAHPAPSCALKVLQLGQAFALLRRGSVHVSTDKDAGMKAFLEDALQDAQRRAPFQRFRAALEACGL